jgi:hypothetical protein
MNSPSFHPAAAASDPLVCTTSFCSRESGNVIQAPIAAVGVPAVTAET